MKNEAIYQKRRQALASQFSRTLFVIPTGSGANRSHSVQYRFKVGSDFNYLSGLSVSDAVLVIAGSKSYLFQNQNLDPVWGEFSGLSAEDHVLLKDIQIESISSFQHSLNDLITQFDRIAISFGRDSVIEQSVLQLIQFQRRSGRSRNFAIEVCDSRLLIGNLRALKDENEIELLKIAGAKSSRVHQNLMQQNLVGKTEREVSNWIEAQFLLENMQWTSYETIVGVGKRSTVLHARATDQVVKNKHLVLVDAGAEWKGYCADITRTFPAASRFTPEQREVYEIVLAAQKAALNLIRPGITLQSIHETVFEVFKEKLDSKINLKSLMPHSTSHWIGLDVHDPCAYLDESGHAIKLKAGMCFTVEPGLYFNAVDGFERFEGIGVRIEDDVVVTQEGFLSFTSVQKEVDEIEELRALGHNQ